MATVSDITKIPLANAYWIDALLNAGPDWNFLTSNGTEFRTTLYYTFSVTSGTESGMYATAFNSTQRAATNQILAHASEVTGIHFVESSSGSSADIHFAQANLGSEGLYTSGLCSQESSYEYSGSLLTDYSADAYVYLDNRSSSWFYAANQNPTAGNSGYETLLHELGHALGLKHPFSAITGNSTTLPTAEDNTLNTLMSYTEYNEGTYYSAYSQYDVAAFNWLYGIDGLQGNWGVGTNGVYYTGTSDGETFRTSWSPSGGYNYAYTGEAGTDKLILQQAKSTLTSSYTDGWLEFTGNGDNSLYVNSDIESIQFSDGTWSVASLITAAGSATNTIYGTNAGEYIQGTAAVDQIFALGGNDTIYGGAGFDAIDGGSGIDTAVYASNRSQYTLTSADNYSHITLNTSETLTSIERLKFSDTMLAFDTSGNAGKAYRLYQAAFNRTPDASGLGFWIHAVDNGANLVTDAAAGFIHSVEFAKLYGSAPSNTTFISLLYNNVLHRSLDQSGYDFWVGKLAAGADRAAVLYGFSESTENLNNVAPLIANGITYQEWIG